MKRKKTIQRFEAITQYQNYRELLGFNRVFDNLDCDSIAEMARRAGVSTARMGQIVEDLENSIMRKNRGMHSWAFLLHEHRTRQKQLARIRKRFDLQKEDVSAKEAVELARFTPNLAGNFGRAKTSKSSAIHAVVNDRLLCWAGSDHRIMYADVPTINSLWYNATISGDAPRQRKVVEKHRDIAAYILGDAEGVTCVRCYRIINDAGRFTD